MNYGLHLSAAGALTSMARQDILANNLANLNTVGFKPDSVTSRARLPATLEDGLFNADSNRLLERLGGGTLLDPPRIAFNQGPIQTTGNALDVAIEGDGFFSVRQVDADGVDRVRLTRDGRFTLDNDARLVQSTTGLPMLDTSDREIRLDPSLGVTIDNDGVITQGGRPVARLGFSEVGDPDALDKLGGNLFDAPPEALASRRTAAGRVVQNAVEGSGVNPISALMDIQGAAGAARENLRMMGMFDELMNRTINTFGRVS